MGKLRQAAMAGGFSLVTLASPSVSNATAVLNGGFESGGLTGWTLTDNAWGGFPPNLPSESDVYGSGVAAPGGWPFFQSAPSEGSYAFLNVFDGPISTIKLAQDIFVTADAPVIAFDYRAAWAFGVIAAATKDRTFVVNARTGAVDHPFLILTAEHGDPITGCMPGASVCGDGTKGVEFDTGLLHGSVDLSPFAGQTVSLTFEWHIPETFTGPGFFQLDNVRAGGGVVPEPGSLALLALGLAGIAARRRKS
jgi:hypothetical protein